MPWWSDEVGDVMRTVKRGGWGGWRYDEDVEDNMSYMTYNPSRRSTALVFCILEGAHGEYP